MSWRYFLRITLANLNMWEEILHSVCVYKSFKSFLFTSKFLLFVTSSLWIEARNKVVANHSGRGWPEIKYKEPKSSIIGPFKVWQSSLKLEHFFYSIQQQLKACIFLNHFFPFLFWFLLPTGFFFPSLKQTATSCPTVYTSHVKGRWPRRGNAHVDASALTQGRCHNCTAGGGERIEALLPPRRHSAIWVLVCCHILSGHAANLWEFMLLGSTTFHRVDT